MADSLTRDDVTQIAHLARLALSDAEIEGLRTELSAILTHMDALGAVDVDGVEPMTHPVPIEHPLRPDHIEPSLEAEIALAGSHAHTDGCFQVPHIIKTATSATAQEK